MRLKALGEVPWPKLKKGQFYLLLQTNSWNTGYRIKKQSWGPYDGYLPNKALVMYLDRIELSGLYYFFIGYQDIFCYIPSNNYSFWEFQAP